MTVLVAKAHAQVQRLVSVVRKATVPEEFATEELRSVVRLLWSKGLNAKDIHKEMFPV
jgi:Mg2+/Co2+ transporter CorB